MVKNQLDTSNMAIQFEIEAVDTSTFFTYPEKTLRYVPVPSNRIHCLLSVTVKQFTRTQLLQHHIRVA